MKKFILIIFLIIIFWALSAVLKPHHKGLGTIKEGNMKLTTVFNNNERIPAKYTCDGEDLAPELTISDVPQDAKSLVLIVDDPDAPMGTWVHWLVYNIPINTTKLDYKNLPTGAKQGMTDFKRIGWGGPCPPYGVHRYFFKLYAIDEMLDLDEGVTKSQLEKTINGHIIEQAQIIGLYERKELSKRH